MKALAIAEELQSSNDQLITEIDEEHKVLFRVSDRFLVFIQDGTGHLAALQQLRDQLSQRRSRF